MREAHKTPCDDIYCEQFLCVQNRDSEGHVELKDWDEHTADLRASNAALKAENEALKADIKANMDGNLALRKKCGARENETMFMFVERLASSLSLYTSWQPSDPGTKEAMEYFAEKPDCRKYETLNRNIETVLNSYRAAMVRLEEAEKEIARLMALIREVKI